MAYNYPSSASPYRQGGTVAASAPPSSPYYEASSSYHRGAHQTSSADVYGAGRGQQTRPSQGGVYHTELAPNAQHNFNNSMNSSNRPVTPSNYNNHTTSVGSYNNSYTNHYNSDSRRDYDAALPRTPYNNGSVVTMQAPDQTLLDWFNAVDTDRSGRIDAIELANALRRGGINLSVLGAARIISMFDTNRSGQIQFEEFRQLHPFVQHMAKSFKLRDRNLSGRVEPAEIRNVLSEAGYAIDTPTFHILMQKFDSEGRGSLGFEDYVQMIVYLHSVKRTFEHYDRNGSGKVFFTCDSFLEAAVSVR